MSDAADIEQALIRRDFDALELLLSRKELWASVISSTGEPIVDDTRQRFERRRDELASRLASTKSTMLSGYAFFPQAVESGADRDLVLARPTGDDPPLGLGELLPGDTLIEVPYDIEISITVRPHCAAGEAEAE